MSGSTKASLTRRILNLVAGASQGRRRKQHATSLIESLEDRQLLAATTTLKVATTPVAPPRPSTSTSTAKTAANLSVAGIVPLSETFNLSSRPSATKTIYLDFDGHTTSNTAWNTTFNGGADFTTPAFDLDGDTSTFSTAELLQIQRMWQRVVEDFAPFDVNVTTKDPGLANIVKSGASDSHYGMRVVIGGDNAQWLKLSAGGIAFIGSFGSSIDLPCFAFSDTQGDDEQVIVETISHETGHTLGLNHDGTASLGYYGGQGTSPMSWGPIMGASFGIDITQWSKGEYPGANNKEDDLSIITTQNGFGYRNDDYGNSRQTASQIPSKKVGSVRNVNVAGVIEKNTDVDFFSFATTGGAVNLSFAGDALGSNLDISVTLYDSSGVAIATVNPALSLNAQLAVTLPAGTYTVSVDGVGFGSASTGYSDYGSLGQYTITGTIPDTSSGTANGGSSIINGRVVSDANADGIVNGTDAGIGGVMVYIDLDGNGAFNSAVDKSARTDASGNFQFTGLLGGTYLVYEVVPTGWQQVRSSGGQSVFVAAASTTSGVFFRNARPPVLTGMSAAVSYKSGSSAVLLTPSADVTDADTTTFGGAKLTVAISQNADPTDVLSVRNEGNGAFQVGYFGGVLRYSGLAVGTVSGGLAGSNLVITFNSSATLAVVKAVLRNLTFVSTSPATSKLVRTLTYSLGDGTGTVSNTATNQVKVT